MKIRRVRLHPNWSFNAAENWEKLSIEGDKLTFQFDPTKKRIKVWPIRTRDGWAFGSTRPGPFMRARMLLGDAANAV